MHFIWKKNNFPKLLSHFIQRLYQHYRLMMISECCLISLLIIITVNYSIIVSKIVVDDSEMLYIIHQWLNFLFIKTQLLKIEIKKFFEYLF